MEGILEASYKSAVVHMYTSIDDTSTTLYQPVKCILAKLILVLVSCTLAPDPIDPHTKV